MSDKKKKINKNVSKSFDLGKKKKKRSKSEIASPGDKKKKKKKVTGAKPTGIFSVGWGLLTHSARPLRRVLGRSGGDALRAEALLLPEHNAQREEQRQAGRKKKPKKNRW